MKVKTYRLYTSAPLENIDLEQQQGKKLKDVNSFKNHINNIKGLITYLKDKNNKSKEKYRKYKTLTTILKSFDTFVIIATKSSSITFSLTGIGLLTIPISTATACRLSFGNEVIYEKFINKYNFYKKQYEKEQETIKSSDKLYRKPRQDNIIGKTEYESLCNIFTKYVEEKKI